MDHTPVSNASTTSRESTRHTSQRRLPTLGKNGKRALDLVHLLAAGIWLGGFVILLAMATSASEFTSGSTPEATTGLAAESATGHAAYGISLVHSLTVFCIPALMITAVLYGAFTKWGFFKQRWLVAKWVLGVATVAASALASSAALRSTATGGASPESIALLAVVVAGIVALFAISVFKPRLGQKRTA